MRAALAVALTSAVPPLRAARTLQLTARPAVPLALENSTSRAMGQALSLLPPPLRPGRRGVAAKASKAAIDRPNEEDPDLWWVLAGSCRRYVGNGMPQANELLLWAASTGAPHASPLAPAKSLPCCPARAPSPAAAG